MVLRPQPGAQERFLASDADITIYGGGAGAGKSYAEQLDTFRGLHDPEYRGVIFRRTIANITNQGSLWDASMRLYPLTGATPTRSPKLKWTWPSGASVVFAHLQHEHTVEDHKGAEYTSIAFDELTEFTESQFWYMLSRLRSPLSRFRPWVRATTNPDATSWVRELLDWWIGPDGLPIFERSGVKRWMTRGDDGQIDWFDEEDAPEKALSLTFIPATVYDNPALLDANPNYINNLEMLPKVERDRLLGGNWNVVDRIGIFQHHAIDPEGVHWDEVPEGLRWVRYWDLADSEPTEKRPDPDASASVLLATYTDPETELEHIYIADAEVMQLQGASKQERIKAIANRDREQYGDVLQALEVEPGGSGKEVAGGYRDRVLVGHAVELDRPTGSKTARASRWLPHAEQARLHLIRNKDGSRPAWFDLVLRQVAIFPDKPRDLIDSISGGYKVSHARGSSAIAFAGEDETGAWNEDDMWWS